MKLQPCGMDETIHKILFVSDHPSPHMADLFRSVHSHPYFLLQVLFASARDKNRNWPGDRKGFKSVILPRFSIGNDLPLNPDILRYLYRHIRKGYIPILSMYSMPTTLCAILLLKLIKHPWLFYGEPVGVDYKAGKLKCFLRNFLVSWLLKNCSGILAISRNGVQSYQKICPRTPVFHFQYYENTDQFRNFQRKVSGVPSFLFCGSLSALKNPGVAICASEILMSKECHHCLNITGDGPMKNKLLKYCKERSLTHIHFSGTIGWEIRHRAFEGSNIFIHPTQWDGFGLVIVEALAAGMPVITTRMCGAGVDFIEDGKNGFLLEQINAEILAEKMEYFIKNPEKIGEMGEKARKSVERWTSENGAERLLKIVNQCIKS